MSQNSLNGITRLLLAAVITALIACGGAKQAGSDGPSELTALFPLSELPEGTVAGSQAQVYSGRELYDLINGGADIFMEFGCEETAVKEYASGSGVSIVAKIYRMEDSEAAYGIFSVNRKISHRPVSKGTIGARGDYRVLFCAGEYFVDVQAADRDQVTAAALDEIASRIELELADEPDDWPDILSLLPRRGLIPHTETYLEGPLGLNSLRFVGDENVFTISDSIPGAFGAYRMRENSNPASFLVVQYPDSTLAEAVFSSVTAFYRDKADLAAADSATAKITDKRIVYTHLDRMDVVILRTTQITALFDQAGALHDTGKSNPHSAVKPERSASPHGTGNPPGGGMSTGSGSKN
ncbi:MAG: hypothetical protein FVQ81_04105 [Candidatus Glassbacteria bacterium]|nr:hypothetical protein [Candidatus Glassbacteria bacterium]